MKKCITSLLGIGMLLWGASAASAIDVSFVKLTGITGGQIAGTGVWRADLSGLGLTTVSQIVLTDTSQGFGGFTGRFSGFDLDAIVLANSSVNTAPDAKTLATLPGFNYFPAATAVSPGTLITPGTQRAPVNPLLFGTVAGPPVKVDPTVATLGLFDGNATIFDPFVKGFVTMGDGGVLTFNLTSPVSTTNLFLYIGEVGDNGETVGGSVNSTIPGAAAGIISDLSVKVFGQVASVPEPSSIALLAVGLAGLVGVGYRCRRTRR